MQLPDLLFTLMKGGSQERTREDDFAFSVLVKMERMLGLFQHASCCVYSEDSLQYWKLGGGNTIS